MPEDISPITVDIARSEADWAEGLGFCADIYKHTYGCHWVHRPDVLFIVRDDHGPVATAGLELGWLRPYIDTERYFRLSPRMAAFIDANRGRIAEFGRFTCASRASIHGSRTVLSALLSYCIQHGVEYLFAWARPSVARHGATRLGVPFWVVDVPLDEETIRTDTAWSEPPVNFFFGGETPRLLLSVIPFFELVSGQLARDCPGSARPWPEPAMLPRLAG